MLLAASAACAAQEVPSAEQLLNDLACGACHDGIPVESDIKEKAPDLTAAGMRYNPGYVYRYLRFPVQVRQHIGSSRMPTFHLHERESLALALYLAEQMPDGGEPPVFASDPDFQEARSSYPAVTDDIGRAIFRSLNCVACHEHASVNEPEEKNAPDLSFEGARVTREWLTGFLRRPTAVRPNGFYPGSGSRMPDFRLMEPEVQVLSEYLMQQRGGFDYPARPLAEEWTSPLSPEHAEALLKRFEDMLLFSATKAEDLMSDKLSCLGCHRLGSGGGRVGPDLSWLNSRLQPGFARQIVRAPKTLLPGAVMPKVEMPTKTLDLLETYLMEQEATRDSGAYLSLIDNLPHFYQDYESGQSLYVQYCSRCHGGGGDGDGFNATYLPIEPTRHSDSTYMSTRPDDTLFDGIYAGGYILNKSNMMPSWGFTLSRDEIWSLVAYIRQLCNCQGPAWSRDNKRLPPLEER
jgi:mono/diheme cytochrome c family protein